MTTTPPLVFIEGRCFKVTTYHIDNQGNRTEEPVSINRAQLPRIEKLALEIFKQLPKEQIGIVSKVTSEGFLLGDRFLPIQQMSSWTSLTQLILEQKEKMQQGGINMTPLDVAEELAGQVLEGKQPSPHITAAEISLALQQNEKRKAGQAVNPLPEGLALKRAQSIPGLPLYKQVAELNANAADQHIPKNLSIPNNIRAEIDAIYNEYYTMDGDTKISESLHNKILALVSKKFTNSDSLCFYYQLVALAMGQQEGPNCTDPNSFSQYWKQLAYLGKAADERQKARYESEMACLIEALAVFADADGAPLNAQPSRQSVNTQQGGAAAVQTWQEKTTQFVLSPLPFIGKSVWNATCAVTPFIGKSAWKATCALTSLLTRRYIEPRISIQTQEIDF
ncbi:MAG: hypothetical protein RLZZ453_238 [Chlamydiota bacterium]|jgi:hypothetical protein